MSLLSDGVPLDSVIPDEVSLKRFWQNHIQSSNLVQTAVTCGLHADRLAWIFCSAYQCALREEIHGIPDHEWWALAASEDTRGELPGVSYDKGVLHGFKTWVAASKLVDAVVVTVGRSAYVVRRDASGTEIKTYPAGSFLGDMSVGRLELNGVAVDDPVDIGRDFALTEPFYITAAALGYLLKEATRLDARACIAEARAGIETLGGFESRGYIDQIAAFAALYRRVSDLGKTMGEISRAAGDQRMGDWEGNGKLLSMYRRGIEKRLSSAG